MAKAIDLTGQVFGRWTVLERDYSSPGQGARWICKCSCSNGTIRSVKSQSLRSGRSQSCGCLQKEIAGSTLIDITGETFGELTVLKKDKTIHPDEAYWICKCSCGAITHPIRGSSLRNGHTTSCGHIDSKGEEKIARFLSQNNISFIREFTFEDLKGDRDKLRFDFAVFKDNNLLFLIEYQGRQHYIEEDNLWSKDGNFDKRISYDNKKREYCKNNHIELLEISYIDFSNIEIILQERINNYEEIS